MDNLTALYLIGGLIGLSIVLVAAGSALYIERRHRKKHPSPMIFGKPTDGVFTITYDGETSMPIAWDATAEAINVVLQYPARKRGIAEASGAEHEAEFYSGYNDGTRPYDPKWTMTEGRWWEKYEAREYYAPPQRWSWSSKGGLLYCEESFKISDEALRDAFSPVQKALNTLQEIWQDSAWDWTCVIGDAEDHIIRSEN